MNVLLRERLIRLLSEPTQVTNEEMKRAYEDFVEQVAPLNQSQIDYSEVFRILNFTRIELVSIELLYQYEQGGKMRLNLYIFKKHSR